MAQNIIQGLIAACTATITAHAEELTALDQAIGDGDHGLNMTRGFNAVAAAADEIAALPFDEALQKAGLTLVMKVGGASGPLYGSALMAMGKATPQMPRDHAEAAAMLAAGIDAVKARGKSDAGAKTMLDVLIPVHAALSGGGGLAKIRQTASTAIARLNRGGRCWMSSGRTRSDRALPLCGDSGCWGPRTATAGCGPELR